MVLPELGAYLEGIGALSLTRGTNLFEGKVPADPDALVALLHYGGLADEMDLGSGTSGGIRIEFPRIQVLCRGARDDYSTPMQKAQDVKTQLSKVLNTTLTGVFYLTVQCENGPFFMRRDDNDRVEIVANYQVMKRYSAT